MDRFGQLLDEVAVTAASLVAADLPTIRRPQGVIPRTVQSQTFNRQRGFVVYVLRQNGFRFREVGAYFLLSPVHTIQIYRRFKIGSVLAVLTTEQFVTYQQLIDENGNGMRITEVETLRPLSSVASVPAINGKAIEQQLGVVEGKVKQIIRHINVEQRTTREGLQRVETEWTKFQQKFDLFKLTT